jgi:hypothetical protein
MLSKTGASSSPTPLPVDTVEIDENPPSEHAGSKCSDRSSLCEIQQPPHQIQSEENNLRKQPWRRAVTEFSYILDSQYEGHGTEQEPYIVRWLANDPENPKTYNNLFKWTMTLLTAQMTLCVSLASSAYIGARELLIEEFGCSNEVFLVGLSVMVFGFTAGSLIWAPICEVWGRREVFLVAMVLYIIFTAACAAAQNVATLIVLRFFCGTIGGAAFVVPGGLLSDLFEAEQRGMAQAIFAAAPFLGPSKSNRRQDDFLAERLLSAFQDTLLAVPGQVLTLL